MLGIQEANWFASSNSLDPRVERCVDMLTLGFAVRKEALGLAMHRLRTATVHSVTTRITKCHVREEELMWHHEALHAGLEIEIASILTVPQSRNQPSK